MYTCSDQMQICFCIYEIFYIYVFLVMWTRSKYTHVCTCFPLQVTLAVKIKYFCVKSKKHFNHSYFRTNTTLKPRSHAPIYTRYANYTLCIICTRVYFWACERNCIYVKVNLRMCKYTPPCKYTPAQTRCIFAFTYMYFIHICIFGHVNAQQIYTRMQM